MAGQRHRFQVDPLREMVAVGRIAPRVVYLWMRSQHPGDLCLRWWPEHEERRAFECIVHIAAGNYRDNTTCVALPCIDPSAPALEPYRRYQFRVTHNHDGHTIGEGRFETAPEHPKEAPKRFSIAIMSCHQPFDNRGRVLPTATLMLRAAHRCLEQHNTKIVLLVGDQLYTDFPPRLSLFRAPYFSQVAPPGRERILDCTAEEIRRIYHDRYRIFWSLPEWRALHALYPCYPIWDDHEIIDNWGSDPAHQTATWAGLGAGARAAYFDYQGTRMLSSAAETRSAYHYAAAYGPVALFVMDLRSERRAGENGQVVSGAQEADLQSFFAQHGDKAILCLVLSIPAIHLPEYAAELVARITPNGEDFSDRWSTGAHIRDRDRLLALIEAQMRRRPEQRIFLLSGDIHIACVYEIRWEGSGLRFYQFISSAITHKTSWIERLIAKIGVWSKRRVFTQDGRLGAKVRFLKGVRHAKRNPYGDLNLGIIDIETPDSNAAPKVHFRVYGHKGDNPICVYQSPEL